MARWRPGQGKTKPDELYTVEIYRDARTGVAVSEKWLKDGLVHRVDGPAVIVRDAETGTVTQEFWFRNNKPHREDGPAALARDPVTGRIKYSTWHIDGQKIRSPRRPRPSATTPSPQDPNPAA